MTCGCRYRFKMRYPVVRATDQKSYKNLRFAQKTWRLTKIAAYCGSSRNARRRELIRSDNRSEYVANAVRVWLGGIGAKILIISPPARGRHTTVDTT